MLDRPWPRTSATHESRTCRPPSASPRTTSSPAAAPDHAWAGSSTRSSKHRRPPFFSPPPGCRGDLVRRRPLGRACPVSLARAWAPRLTRSSASSPTSRSRHSWPARPERRLPARRLVPPGRRPSRASPHRPRLPRAAHRTLGGSGRRRAPDLLIAPRLGKANALQFGHIADWRPSVSATRAWHSLASGLRAEAVRMPPETGGVLFVHAHPDDESSRYRRHDRAAWWPRASASTSSPAPMAPRARSTIRRSTRRRHDRGWRPSAPPSWPARSTRSGAGAIHHHLLGYRDSGMIGTDANAHPDVLLAGRPRRGDAAG